MCFFWGGGDLTSISENIKSTDNILKMGQDEMFLHLFNIHYIKKQDQTTMCIIATAATATAPAT